MKIGQQMLKFPKKNNVQICFLSSPIFVFYVDKNNNNYAQWHMHGWINQGINKVIWNDFYKWTDGEGGNIYMS